MRTAIRLLVRIFTLSPAVEQKVPMTLEASSPARKRRYGASLAMAVVLVAGCASHASTAARQASLKATEDKVVAARLGALLLHRIGGRNSVSGDKPYRYSYYAASNPADAVTQVKARLANAGLRSIRNDQRCDQTDPCAFQDPANANVLVSVVFATTEAVVKADHVKLPGSSSHVIVVGIF